MTYKYFEERESQWPKGLAKYMHSSRCYACGNLQDTKHEECLACDGFGVCEHCKTRLKMDRMCIGQGSWLDHEPERICPKCKDRPDMAQESEDPYDADTIPSLFKIP